MIGNQLNRNLRTIITVLFFVAAIFLLPSVIKSGRFYQLDGDEVFHSQVVFLENYGYQPYTSFYMNYSPILYGMIAPVWKHFGFELATFDYVRVFMTGLFLVSLLASSLFVRNLVGTMAAAIFFYFYLSDPFMVFSAMQIRPDNIAVLFLSFALLFISLDNRRYRYYWIFSGGIFLGLSLAASIKLTPTVFTVLSVFFLMSFFSRSKFSVFGLLLLGFFIPLSFMFITAAASGYGIEMVRQILIDPLTENVVASARIKFGNFYGMENYFLYGLPGRPLNMLFIGVIYVLSAFGILKLCYMIIKKITAEKTGIFLILILAPLGHYLALFFLPSVFIQYYLVLHYYLAMLSAIAVTGIIRFAKNNHFLSVLTVSILFTGIFLLTKTNITANNNRSKIDSQNYFNQCAVWWENIPEGEAVFPNILFRPLGYPLVTHSNHYDRPQSVLDRLGPIRASLENKRVPWVMIDDYLTSRMDPEDVSYIKANYRLLPGTTYFYRRLEKY